jgi:hypothetical protein
MAGDGKSTDLLLGIDSVIDCFQDVSIDVYVGSELTDYINGGAALFYSYNFSKLLVKKLISGKNRHLTIEIYEFDISKNAFGIYSFDREGEHPHIGHEAAYADGLLKFWKDRFYVRVFAPFESEATKSDILALGERIAQNIEQLGTKPELLSRIPESNVLEGSIHYFHEDICLNNFYYIDGDNLLNLNADTEAVTYEYEIGQEVLRVILVRYLTREHAGAAYTNFVTTYLGQPPVSGSDSRGDTHIIRKNESGKYLGVRLLGNHLIAVFEAINEDLCRRALYIQGVSL